MIVWLQRHDSSTEDLADGARAAVLAWIEDFDWGGELKKADDAAENGENFCPPGIGFNDDDGRVLHILPTSVEAAKVHYVYPAKRRILGVVPQKFQEVVTREEVSHAEWIELVEKHYDQSHAEIMAAFGDDE